MMLLNEKRNEFKFSVKVRKQVLPNFSQFISINAFDFVFFTSQNSKSFLFKLVVEYIPTSNLNLRILQ